MKRQKKQKEAKAGSTALPYIRETYTHPQTDGLLSVREFVLTEVQARRCLFLHWVKDADFAVESVTFRLEELDAAGRTLASREVTHAKLPTVESGETFVLARGIVVHPRCTDVRVQVVRVVSDAGYVYSPAPRAADGSEETHTAPALTAEYVAKAPWVYDNRGRRRDGLRGSRSLYATSKRYGSVRGLWLPAVVTALLLLGLLIWFYFPHEDAEASQTDTAAHRPAAVTRLVDA